MIVHKINLKAGDMSNKVWATLYLYESKEDLLQEGYTKFPKDEDDGTYWDYLVNSVINTLYEYSEEFTKGNIAIALHESFEILLGEEDADKLAYNIKYMKWAFKVLIRNLMKAELPSGYTKEIKEFTVEVYGDS